MDKGVFLSNYFNQLTRKFKEIIPPAELKQQVLLATRAMVLDNRADITNREVFWEHFLAGVKRPADELQAVFADFYANEFKKLISFTRPNPTARELVKKLAGRGCRLALATNPIFPREATIERMKWAGIEDLPWELVTTFEEYHFCKPNPAYYGEMLERLNLPAEQALMVGNDVAEDMAAGALGIKTYLATDDLIDCPGSPWQPDYVGKLAELPGRLGL